MKELLGGNFTSKELYDIFNEHKCISIILSKEKVSEERIVDTVQYLTRSIKAILGEHESMHFLSTEFTIEEKSYIYKFWDRRYYPIENNKGATYLLKKF